MYFAIAQTRYALPLQVRFFSSIDAAVPKYEAEIKSFADDYDEFMQQQTKSRKTREMPLDALTAFINKSLLERTLSYSEHLDFLPVTEEFAYYVVQWRASANPGDATLD
jgi:hypothetical protein